MKCDWSTPRCILCRSGEDITSEHLIPDCLGGKLVAEFLCRACNSNLGHGAEGAVRKDPEIRRAIDRLALSRSALGHKLQRGLPYRGCSEQGKISGYFQEGKFVPSEQKLDDGSLIVPEDRSLHHVKRMAERDGSEPYEITVDRFKSLSSGESVEAAPGIVVTNWLVDSIAPDLNGPEIDPIVPTKIAFEWLALHCGSAIYENPPQLASIRRQLIEGKLSGDEIRVQRLEAQNCRLFHGLAFEGNSPGARVQIRFFGSLAFRVEFSRLSVSGTRYGYTHDLVSGHDDRGCVSKVVEI